MRDNTFTPGPWTFKTAHNGDNGIIANGTGVFIEAFAEIRHSGEDARGEAKANARLIASAPDLYSALWEAVELSDRTLPDSGRTAECQRVYDLCVAALKKAEGDA